MEKAKTQEREMLDRLREQDGELKKLKTMLLILMNNQVMFMDNERKKDGLSDSAKEMYKIAIDSTVYVIINVLNDKGNKEPNNKVNKQSKKQTKQKTGMEELLDFIYSL